MRACPPYELPCPRRSRETTRLTSACVSFTRACSGEKSGSVAGAGHTRSRSLAGAFRLEVLADAEPQDLREVVNKTRRRAQDFGRGRRQHPEPRALSKHIAGRDVENVGLFGGVDHCRYCAMKSISTMPPRIFQLPDVRPRPFRSGWRGASPRHLVGDGRAVARPASALADDVFDFARESRAIPKSPARGSAPCAPRSRPHAPGIPARI